MILGKSCSFPWTSSFKWGFALYGFWIFKLWSSEPMILNDRIPLLPHHFPHPLPIFSTHFCGSIIMDLPIHLGFEEKSILTQSLTIALPSNPENSTLQNSFGKESSLKGPMDSGKSPGRWNPRFGLRTWVHSLTLPLLISVILSKFLQLSESRPSHL